MTANLHAIWLDDLAPGEGATTPIWDALYAEQDAETQRVVFNACADEHTEPVVVVMDMTVIEFPTDFGSDDKTTQATSPDESSAATPSEPKPPKKKPAPRKPAAKKATPRKKPGVLADAEAKLAGVAARVKAQADELGGAS